MCGRLVTEPAQFVQVAASLPLNRFAINPSVTPVLLTLPLDSRYGFDEGSTDYFWFFSPRFFRRYRVAAGTGFGYRVGRV